MSKVKKTKKKSGIKKFVCGALVLTIIGTGVTLKLNKSNVNELKDYTYYTDLLDKNYDNTYIDELFSEGVTINLDDEEVSLKTAVEKMDAANKIYEVLKEYIEESEDTQEAELTEDETNQYIEEYLNSGEQDIDYINNLIEEYKSTEDGFEQAKIIRRLVCIENYLSEYTDEHGTEILKKFANLILKTGSMQAYGTDNPDSYKDYTFNYEYEDVLADKVIVTITDEATGHDEEIVFNDILGGAGAYVDLYKALQNMNYCSEHGRSTEIMRECYAEVLECSKATLDINPEKANQKVYEILPFIGR